MSSSSFSNDWPIDPADLHILRELLKRKRDLAQQPVMAERRALWTRHAALDSQRPMILIETGGVLDEVVPLSALQCQANWARAMERALREEIFRAQEIRDDYVVEPWLEYQWEVNGGDYGVTTVKQRGENAGKLASYHWEAPIKDLDQDFDRLHFRRLSVNRERTLAWKALLEEHFADILPVRRRGSYWWTSGLTWTAIDLIGLEGFMLAMVDNPAGLHRLMAFLRDDFLQAMDWFEKEELLSLNNENDYVGSGTLGYSAELPKEKAGTNEAAPQSKAAPQSRAAPQGEAAQGDQGARLADLWGLSESQETVGVSPKMFEEFVFQYQVPITQRFGFVYYGCCEPIHQRIHIIQRLPNLRRVSVSPWCNQEKMVNILGDGVIHCCKPNPAMISTDVFDEDAIRANLRATLQVCQEVPLELVMKDVHTVNDQPARMGRWVQIAREVCAEFGFESQ